MAKPTPPPAKPLTVADLRLDANNRRKRTERGTKLLRESLAEVGAARSIVIDESDRVLAGNGTLEAAEAIGLTKVQVIETDGDTVVAVRRRGLSESQKLALALYDNRTAELAEWDAEPLSQDAAAGVLTPFFNPGELRALFKTGNSAAHDRVTVKEIDTSTVHDKFWIAVEGPLPAQAEALRKLRAVMAEIPGITVELGTIPSESWEPTK